MLSVISNCLRKRFASSIHQSVSEKRLITQKDVEDFARLSGDFNPLHYSEDGKPGIVHGAFLVSLVSGVIGTKLPGPGTLLLSQSIVFPKPCFVGDIVIINVNLLSDRKICTCEYTVVSTSSKSIVLSGDARVLKKKLD